MLCAVLCVLVVALAFVGGPVKLIVVAAFTLFPPGWAILAFWPAVDRETRVVLSMGLSIAIVTITASAAFALHIWNANGVYDLLALLTLIALAARWRAMVELFRPLHGGLSAPGQSTRRGLDPGHGDSAD